VPGAIAKYWGTGLQVESGEVIAVDQDQRPALVANTLGKGKTLLSAYPLESYLGSQPLAFEKDEKAYQLFRALRIWGGVRPRVSTDQPSVEASALIRATGGYVVLANHSPEARKTTITSSLPIQTLRQLTSGAGMTVQQTQDKDSWTIDLAPYAGAILEWKSR
jgi:hypothetical protein